MRRFCEIKRFPDAKKLASYAGPVPRADKSGNRTSEHRPVKRGNKVLKYFKTWAAMGAAHSKRLNSVGKFNHQLAARKPGRQAGVATARKLTTIVSRVLMSGEPQKEPNPDLVEIEIRRLSHKAEGSPRNVSEGEFRASVITLKRKGRSSPPPIRTGLGRGGHKILSGSAVFEGGVLGRDPS